MLALNLSTNFHFRDKFLHLLCMNKEQYICTAEVLEARPFQARLIVRALPSSPGSGRPIRRSTVLCAYALPPGQLSTKILDMSEEVTIKYINIRRFYIRIYSDIKILMNKTLYSLLKSLYERWSLTFDIVIKKRSAES